MTIATRIRLLCVSLVLLSGVMLVWVTWADREAQVLAALEADARSVAISAARAVNGSIRMQQAQASFISKVPMVAAFVREPADPRLRANIDIGMSEYLRVHGDVFKARVLDRNGDEFFRADELPSGEVRVATLDEYQNRAQSPYFRESIGTSPGDRYVSAIGLNREFGAVEMPPRPTVRVGGKVEVDDHEAVVLFNLDLSRLFAVIGEGFAGTDTRLYDAGGEALLHPDPERAFAFEFGRSARLEEDFPELARLARASEDGRASVLLDGGYAVAALEPVTFGEGPSARRASIVVVRTRAGLIVPFSMSAVLIALTALLCASVAAGVAASRIARPLEQMTAAVASYGEAGRVSVELPVDAPAEVGALARAFRSMEREVRHRESALRRANSDLDQFAHMTAHDLREPVRRVAMFADVVGEALDPADEEAHSMLERIRAQAEYQMGLIRSFEVLSRISAGELQTEWIDLDALVASVIADHRERLDERSASADVGRLGQLNGFPTLLRSAFSNLVGNALRHADEGFELRFEREDSADEIRIVVRNTGSSVSEDQLDSILRPFVRLHRREDEGQGLGLAIVVRVVEKHQGTVTVSSEQDSFAVTLHFPAE